VKRVDACRHRGVGGENAGDPHQLDGFVEAQASIFPEFPDRSKAVNAE
jgi:hypothetical protein